MAEGNHNKGWKRRYADMMKFYGVGYSSLLGRFQGIINLALLASVYLLGKGVELSFIQTIVFGVCLLAFILISGFIYIKMGLQKAEAVSAFVENPQLCEMYAGIQRIETRLNKLEELYEQKSRNL